MFVLQQRKVCCFEFLKVRHEWSRPLPMIAATHKRERVVSSFRSRARVIAGGSQDFLGTTEESVSLQVSTHAMPRAFMTKTMPGSNKRAKHRTKLSSATQPVRKKQPADIFRGTQSECPVRVSSKARVTEEGIVIPCPRTPRSGERPRCPCRRDTYPERPLAGTRRQRPASAVENHNSKKTKEEESGEGRGTTRHIG